MMLRNSLLCTAMLLTACGKASTEDQFRSGLPTKEMVQVKSPDTKGQSLSRSQALVSAEDVRAQDQGQTSAFYAVTRGATQLVNGATLAVLGLVGGVTKYPPTSIKDNTAVWGPHDGDALDPKSWRLTVTKLADNSYSYALAAKNKDAADSTFVDVITGTQTAATDAAGEPEEGFGQGAFTLDWDKLGTLKGANPKELGTLAVKYARPDAKSAVTVEAHFKNVYDGETDGRTSADYGYSSVPGQGGQFDFKQIKDIYKPSSTVKNETLTIRSRWMETGAGRSDIQISGGDLGTPATLNECWDTSFLSQFQRTNLDLSTRSNYGEEAKNCAFTSASYSTLP